MSLPLDLLSPILESLENSDLEACTLVAVAFHRVARQLLFAHIVLCSDTWRAKCAFALDSRGVELRRSARKVTLIIDGIPILKSESDLPRLLQLFFEEIGPCLDAFRVQTSSELWWRTFHHSFREIITSTMPHIRSLEVLGVSQIPLVKTLSYFPHLRRLSLKSEDFIIGIPEDLANDDILRSSVPKIASLSVAGFTDQDFEESTSLTQFMLLATPQIHCLTLDQSSTNHYPLYWDFLQAFTSSLYHISFGKDLYRTVVPKFWNYTLDELSSEKIHRFSQLQSVTISIPHDASPEEWEPWWPQIAQGIQNLRNLYFLPSLNALRFVLPSSFALGNVSSASLPSLSELVVHSSFEIHIVISCPATDFPQMANDFRTCLPSWDAAGRLKFWMRI
ncbi:hypothetical protein DL96DRAFT_1638642 [Flagelloscypha sp. PMI_526]|nr:hypothetical protein DL96DRAFT_1638642 [Flagelloscypha sp. PMI_526]